MAARCDKVSKEDHLSSYSKLPHTSNSINLIFKLQEETLGGLNKPPKNDQKEPKVCSRIGMDSTLR